jgi:hypothetical protein
VNKVVNAATVPPAAAQTPPTPPLSLPGTNHTWFGLLLYGLHKRRHDAIATTINRMRTGFIASTDSLDFRKCLHIVKLFTGLNNERLAERCKVAVGNLAVMENRNVCRNVDVLDALEAMAREYYLDPVAKWFEAKKMESQYRQRPTKMRDTEK